MITINLYEMGCKQPASTDAQDDQRLDELLKPHDGDVLVLVDDDENIDVTNLDLSRTVGDVAAGRTGLVILRNPLAEVTVDVHYTGLSAPLRAHAPPASAVSGRWPSRHLGSTRRRLRTRLCASRGRRPICP